MSKVASWVPLVVALVLNAAANVLLRIGAVTEPSVGADPTLVRKALAFLNGVTLVAMVLFGLNLLFYRKALERVPLSVAYPIMLAGSLVLATLAARFIPVLQETISTMQVAGMVVIVVGAWMVTRT